MKNKLSIIIISVIGIIFIFIGFINLFSMPTQKQEKIEKTETLRKITEEEISHETALEIVEFYLEKRPIEDKIEIEKVKVYSNSLNGEYLVRIEIKNDVEEIEEKETILKYLGNGEWKVEIPLKNEGEIDYTPFIEFWPETVELD